MSTGERALSAVLAVVVLSMAGYMAATRTQLPKLLVVIPLVLMILLGVYQFVRDDPYVS